MEHEQPTLALELVWIVGRDRKPVDPELFSLLNGIKRTGKLTKAAAEVGLPYRQAWGLITYWSERIGQPLVVKEQGRGTQLTLLGERLLWIRERINARMSPHLESAAAKIDQYLNEVLHEAHPSLSIYASYDLALAALRDFLRTRMALKVDVRFVGSLNSLLTLCKSRCDLAGFHIPEGELGRDAFSRYEPWLKPRLHRLIRFLRRTQGLIVSPGNPLGIRNLADVAQTKARFINRQRGSGTHLALEAMLKSEDIDKDDIVGFHTEEFTHLAVAAAVSAGVADVGLGIEAAARRLNMDFVPLFKEDYYLLAKYDTLEREDVQSILSILRAEPFRKIVHEFRGYDASQAGTVATLAEMAAM